MHIKTLASGFSSEKLIYVFLHIITILLRFVKSFVFMSFLSMHELGILTLISSVMAIFSLVQIGLLNGGYRIFCLDDQNKWEVNEIIYAFFIIIWGVLVIGILIIYLLALINFEGFLFGIFGTILGILALFNNWNRNLLVAESKFKKINTYEIVSTLVAFSMLFLVPILKIYAALLVMVILELVFYLLAIIGDKKFIPSKLTFSIKKIKWILKIGFIPYLASMITLLGSQIETWSIAGFISTEALGVFYLPTLYITFFLLIPLSIDKIYFPLVMKEFDNKNFSKVKLIIRKYVSINATVGIGSICLTLLFMEYFVGLIIPEHLNGIQYVWIIIPGLVIYSILQPFKLIFNAAIKQKPFLWASGISLVLGSSALLILGFFGNLNLSLVAVIKSFSFAITGLIIYVFYLSQKGVIWNYYHK